MQTIRISRFLPRFVDCQEYFISFFLVIHKQSDEYVQFEKWAEKMTSFNQELYRERVKKTFANFCVCFGCFRREG